MRQYLNLLQDILDNGVQKGDRTGTGTLSVFGRQLRFNLADGFPLVTTKKVFLKGVILETLWFLRGETNIQWLVQNGVNIWNDWPHKHYRNNGHVDNLSMEHFTQRVAADNLFAAQWGGLGPVYGKQWRAWAQPLDGDEFERPAIDQLALAVDMLKKNPDSRRNIVMAWNPADIEEMAISGLPPCHFCFQFNTRPAPYKQSITFGSDPDNPSKAVVDTPYRYLDLHLNIRSWDVPIGAPFNIASYALILMLMAREVGMWPGELVITTGDTHIYLNQVEGVREQLRREPLPLPTLNISPIRGEASILAVDSRDPHAYQLEDFQLSGYQSHPSIKFPLAV